MPCPAQRHPAHPPLPWRSGALPHPGLQGGSYLMLYNTSAAAVEQLFEAHSPELAAWCARPGVCKDVPHWGNASHGCLCVHPHAVLKRLPVDLKRALCAHPPHPPCRYLQQPVDLFGPGCSCGCATDWVRCVLPPGGSRAAREVALRDPALAARELRHRLVDELPACSQARQATPYLGGC